MAKVNVIKAPKGNLAMHPKKFIVWLFIVSIVMIFASLTSAYIVRQAEGDWLYFDIPFIFYISTGVIILSSFTMHLAYLQTKRDNIKGVKLWLVITTILGFIFLVTQWQGWKELQELGVFFAGLEANVSGSFFYVISGLHGAHIVSGIVYLLIILLATFRYQIHSKSLTRMQMCATFWHFLDGLWVYLFFFLLLYQS